MNIIETITQIAPYVMWISLVVMIFSDIIYDIAENINDYKIIQCDLFYKIFYKEHYREPCYNYLPAWIDDKEKFYNKLCGWSIFFAIVSGLWYIWTLPIQPYVDSFKSAIVWISSIFGIQGIRWWMVVLLEIVQFYVLITIGQQIASHIPWLRDWAWAAILGLPISMLFRIEAVFYSDLIGSGFIAAIIKYFAWAWTLSCCYVGLAPILDGSRCPRCHRYEKNEEREVIRKWDGKIKEDVRTYSEQGAYLGTTERWKEDRYGNKFDKSRTHHYARDHYEEVTVRQEQHKRVCCRYCGHKWDVRGQDKVLSKETNFLGSTR